MPIRVTCSNCGKRYKLRDDRAGASVRCKICGGSIAVPEMPEGVVELRVNESGTPSLFHAPREDDFQLAIGDGEAIERISDHIEAHIGPVETVIHEIISDLVHIDIHLVRPSEDRPFWSLVTSGMSDLPMTVPEGADASRFAEMVVFLPPDWPMVQEAWKDEAHYWPVRWLKVLARLPHEYKTWLGIGHTVPNGDPPEPFAESTDLCCSLILPPVTVPEEFRELKIDDEKTIQFLAFVPIYREEMVYKLKKGLDALMERMLKIGLSDVIDPDRKNACAKRFGLF